MINGNTLILLKVLSIQIQTEKCPSHLLAHTRGRADGGSGYGGAGSGDAGGGGDASSTEGPGAGRGSGVGLLGEGDSGGTQTIDIAGGIGGSGGNNGNAGSTDGAGGNGGSFGGGGGGAAIKIPEMGAMEEVVQFASSGGKSLISID